MSRVIVVGVDGSPYSEAALDVSIELARGLGDRLVIAYAIEPPQRSVGDEAGELRKALEELGSPVVEAATSRAAEAGVDAEAVLPPRRPAEALLGLAREHEARLIVVGTASTRPLTGLILGSVPRRLVHRSSVPVLVVPLPDAD